MSKYELGIMTSRWTVEAPNVDVAVIALRLWGEYATIPIANFTGDEQSKFMNLLGATKKTEEVVGEFIKENKDAIRDAAKTIKESV